MTGGGGLAMLGLVGRRVALARQGGRLISLGRSARSSDIKGSSSDPKVAADTTFADLPPEVAQAPPSTGGAEGKAIREEVARVMANPEINGQPVALDFSSKGAKGG